MLLEEIRGLSHPNLTQGIAAIRRGRERYVMFPWADGGNLRDLWIDNPEPKVTAGLVRDIIEQLLGMAEALMRLHFWTDQPHVRHGNIKPENILVFPTGDKSCIGTLELSDVGSVRDHSARTQLRSRNSGNSYGTVKYEPPESVTKKLSPRSRLSDIWSMGCVTVEFMVWLLYGYEELKEFNAHISGKLEEPSRFFVVDQIEDQGQQGTFPQLVANVHPAVQACIDHMSKDKECVGETALGDLLNIVKTKLLVVELPNQTVSATAMMENPSVTITNYSSKEPRFGRVRANASQLVHALEEIMQRGIASNERYWLTGHDRDNVRLPRVTLRNITKGRSYYLSPERTLEQDIPGQFDPLVDENGLNEQGEREVVIAVMGVTGAGKSYLIRQVTGQDVVVGDGIAACKSPNKNIASLATPKI
jgi:serine/threonine protein kinase